MIAGADLITYAAAALTPALVFTGSLLVLRRPLAALVVAAPLVCLVPWSAPARSQDAATLLPAAAAALWNWLLLSAHPARRGNLFAFTPMALAALVMCTAAVFAPPILLAALAASAYLALRGKGWWPLVALFAIPLSYNVLIAAAAAGVGRVDIVGSLSSAFCQGWSNRTWVQSSGSGPFREAVSSLGEFFYLPLAGPFAAMGYRYRGRWWFTPTMIWAAVLAAGPIALEGNLNMHYSQPLQMALLIPAGIVGANELLRKMRKQRSRQTVKDRTRGIPTCGS